MFGVFPVLVGSNVLVLMDLGVYGARIDDRVNGHWPSTGTTVTSQFQPSGVV